MELKLFYNFPYDKSFEIMDKTKIEAHEPTIRWLMQDIEI